MERSSSHGSHGRHGGNRGKERDDANKDAKQAATRNTDVESLASDRNVSRAGGHKRGS